MIMEQAKVKENTPTIGELFRRYGEGYIQKHKLTGQEKGIIRLLSSCRTPVLGTHIQQCTHCGYWETACNSCRNRHCPVCQYKNREKWFRKRQQELLPVKYFHIVFTVPVELNELFPQNRKIMYDILFRSASESLIELAKDRKHVGALTGIIAVLHTWGQNLMEHPHLHCMVPAGGLSGDRQQWVHSREDFFISVFALSSMFSGKFCAYLKEANQNNRLSFRGKISHLEKGMQFKQLLQRLYKISWVVNSGTKPFLKPDHALEYLSRYINRIAIANRRILKVEKGLVTFLWKDYRDRKTKRMTLEVHEFIRRFLLHLLPDGFLKIRYYGIFSNRYKRENIEKANELLQAEGALQKEEYFHDHGIENTKLSEDPIWDELYKLIFDKPYNLCPVCGTGKMVYGGQVKRPGGG